MVQIFRCYDFRKRWCFLYSVFALMKICCFAGFRKWALSAKILGFHRSLKRRPYSNKRTPHHNNKTRSNTARTLNPKPLNPNPKAEPCWLVVVLGPRGCSESSWATVPSTATECSKGRSCDCRASNCLAQRILKMRVAFRRFS